MLDEEEYGKWMLMARRTLESAKRDLVGGDYNWACFKSQQAAEFAVKAILWGIGRPKYGHATSKLIVELDDVPDEVIEICKRLDKFYTAPRYADMWSEGAPFEYYSRREAEEAIYYAERILEFVEGRWRSLIGEERRGGKG
ncbi:MAG: HEPN domain-containing protein [Candidatus Korarchaeota archaeon]|nr:HEPN domain-containing protein [Candidatus Korarchaeota archaeon]